MKKNKVPTAIGKSILAVSVLTLTFGLLSLSAQAADKLPQPSAAAPKLDTVVSTADVVMDMLKDSQKVVACTDNAKNILQVFASGPNYSGLGIATYKKRGTKDRRFFTQFRGGSGNLAQAYVGDLDDLDNLQGELILHVTDEPAALHSSAAGELTIHNISNNTTESIKLECTIFKLSAPAPQKQAAEAPVKQVEKPQTPDVVGENSAPVFRTPAK